MIGELRGTLLVALVGAFVLVGCEDDPLPPGDAGVDAAPSDGGGSDADTPMDADTPTDGEIPRDAPTADGGQDAGMVDAGCSGAAACDDGLFCNGAEQCVDGACVPGTAPVVDDEIDCTVDSCDEDTDMVVHAPSDARCDDMDDCTMDTCTEGVGCTRPYICECRMASDCDDMNPCTDDSCGVDGVCVNANNTADCDDGVYCNGADTCSGGSCGHAGDPCAAGAECADSCDEATDSCFDTMGTACTDDGNVCTDNACDGSGSCVATNHSRGCDDGLFCNGADTCSGGSCGHTGDPCAGGGVCADSCNEMADNCFDPAGTACTDDGNVCTDNTCDGAGACAATNNAVSCDDGVYCNGADTCSGGSCVHAGDPCAGGGSCNNSCNEGDETCFSAVGAACNADALSCTPDTCDGAGTCTAGMPTAPQAVCDSMCVDTSSSALHCGGCDMPCQSGASCESSACVCRDTYVDCGGSCVLQDRFLRVDSGGNVGRNSALVVDPAGGLHVSYFDDTNDTLKYAYRDLGGAWTTSTVVTSVRDWPTAIALDSAGGVHIVFDAVEHAYKPAGMSSWTITSIVPGGTSDVFIDLAVDSADGVHVSYRSASRELSHAYLPSGGAWSTEVVTGTSDNITSTSIAADGLDLHITYSVGNDLGYAVRPAGGMWTTATIDTAGNVTGSECEVAVDARGVHVAHRYRSGSSYSLRYSFLPSLGGGWTHTNLVGGDAGEDPEILTDASGTVHILHRDSGVVQYTIRATDGSVETRALVSSASSDSELGFGRTAAGEIHLTYDSGGFDYDLIYIRRPACP